jgi:hypothetical protein
MSYQHFRAVQAADLVASSLDLRLRRIPATLWVALVGVVVPIMAAAVVAGGALAAAEARK